MTEKVKWKRPHFLPLCLFDSCHSLSVRRRTRTGAHTQFLSHSFVLIYEKTLRDQSSSELSQPVTRIRSNSSYLIETPVIRFILEHLRMDRYYTSCSAHKLLTELHGAVRRCGVCGLVTRRLLASLCVCDVSVIPVTFLLSQQKICCYRKT